MAKDAVEAALAREVDVPLSFDGVEDMHADPERTRVLPSVDVVCGDVIDVLRGLPAGSVHCCVTSPPYMGLRRYFPYVAVRIRRDLDNATRSMVESRLNELKIVPRG